MKSVENLKLAPIFIKFTYRFGKRLNFHILRVILEKNDILSPDICSKSFKMKAQVKRLKNDKHIFDVFE